MFKLEQVECHLSVNGSHDPVATAVVQSMAEGDLIVGVRLAGAHPDSEYAIVSIGVEADGTVVVRVMDGEGAYLADAIKVKR